MYAGCLLEQLNVDIFVEFRLVRLQKGCRSSFLATDMSTQQTQ